MSPVPGPSLPSGPPLRGDRLHRYVTAFCPACHADEPDRPLGQVRRLAGVLSIREGRVWLDRGCPDHGLISTLYEEDPEILRYLERWTAPTKLHVPDRMGNYLPVPEAYAHGLPAMQTQHTCILLADLTDSCNLRCPTCFAASGPEGSQFAEVQTVLAAIDTRIDREHGRLDVLMLSGGEPTLHPGLPELLDAVVRRPVVRVLLNTNGIALAQDDRLLELLRRHRQRVEVYLQYDGSSGDAARHHRGGDVTRLKEQAVARLSDAGIFTTLTMTAALGVNDGDLGAVIRRALDTPYVGGVAIQPQFGSGRSGPIDPVDRLTHTGVLSRLQAQTDGDVTWSDLTALPCSHPHCASVGYLIRDDSGRWRSLASLVGHDVLASWLDLAPEAVANRVADSALPAQVRAAVKESLLGLLSEQSSLSHPGIGDLWRNVCSACDLGVGTLSTIASASLPGGQERLRSLLANRVVRVTVKPFMDISTMLEERLIQCCVHVATRGFDGEHQCAPFCAVQAWPALAGQRLPLDPVSRSTFPGGDP